MRDPDFIIGRPGVPYLRRWYLTKRIPTRARLYLHHFLRDDDDRALHDHPSWSVSLILRGGYLEHLPGGIVKRRRPGQMVFRRATQPHRIELLRRPDGSVIEAWTLFLFGPNWREWGFHCPQGWRHWKEFCAAGNPGEPGKGCE